MKHTPNNTAVREREVWLGIGHICLHIRGSWLYFKEKRNELGDNFGRRDDYGPEGLCLRLKGQMAGRRWFSCVRECEHRMSKQHRRDVAHEALGTARVWVVCELGGWGVSDQMEGSLHGRINSHQPEVDPKGKKYPNPSNRLLLKREMAWKSKSSDSPVDYAVLNVWNLRMQAPCPFHQEPCSLAA